MCRGFTHFFEGLMNFDDSRGLFYSSDVMGDLGRRLSLI